MNKQKVVFVIPVETERLVDDGDTTVATALIAFDLEHGWALRAPFGGDIQVINETIIIITSGENNAKGD